MSDPTDRQPDADGSAHQSPSPQGGPEAEGSTGWQWNPTEVAPGVEFAYTPQPKPVKLPDQPTRYPMFWRTTGGEWWLNLVALIVALIVFFVAQIVAAFLALGIDVARGADVEESAEKMLNQVVTPGLFLANNLGLAALIPIAWVASMIVGQRPRWMSSVLGRFRWRWLLRCLVVLLPVWVVAVVLQSLAAPPELHRNANTTFMIAAIALTTPLQCAGEEFGFRGIANRAVAAWFARPVVGLLVGGAFSALLFTVAHGASDPWLWLYYFFFGMAACYLAWRTGGLEAPIAMHIVNNLTALSLAPWLDFSSLFDRGAGTAGPEVLIQMAVVLLGVGLVEWQSRRTKVVAVNDPGREAAGYPAVATS